jgi:Acetyltransferase (GNAT) domain
MGVWRIDAVARSEAFVGGVVDPEAVAVAARELFETFGPRTYLRLGLQAERGATARGLEALGQDDGALTVAVPREMCPVLRLQPGDGSWRAIVSPPYRRRLGQDLRRLHAAGTAEFRTSRCARDFAAALSVDRRSWKADRGSDLVSSRHSHVLYRLFAAAAEAEGRLRLYFLDLDGRPIAFLYAVRLGSTAWLLKGSYDQRFARLRPVVMLFTHAIDALAAEGVELIDLWGRADRFKMHWATDYVARSDYYVFPNNLLMRPLSAWVRRRYVQPLVLPQRLTRGRWGRPGRSTRWL